MKVLVYGAGPEMAAHIRAGTQDFEKHWYARAQGTVFYHTSHDTALRLFVLDEEPDEVEARYGFPMPLNDQVLTKCGARLVFEEK